MEQERATEILPQWLRIPVCSGTTTQGTSAWHWAVFALSLLGLWFNETNRHFLNALQMNQKLFWHLCLPVLFTLQTWHFCVQSGTVL